MDTKLIQAVNAYANTASMKGGMNAPGIGDETDAMQPDFDALIRDSLQQARDALYTGESKSAGAIAGAVDPQDLVVAVTNAELTLNTIIAVRDRVIAAYNEIIKMPI